MRFYADASQLINRELLEQTIEIRDVRVFDNDAPAAVLVLDVDLQPESPLEPLLHLFDIRIDDRLS